MPPMPPIGLAGAASGGSSMRPPSRSITCGAGIAGGAACAPSAPSVIMSEVSVLPSSSSSSSSARPPKPGAALRPWETNVEGGLW